MNFKFIELYNVYFDKSSNRTSISEYYVNYIERPII